MTQYLNSFYNPKNNVDNKILTCEHKPIMYRGYMIFHRIKTTSSGGNVFDIVKDGVCIGMNAGINGAKSKIDELFRIPAETEERGQAPEGKEAGKDPAVFEEAAACEQGVCGEEPAMVEG